MVFPIDCISEELLRFDKCFENLLRTRVPLADNVIRYFLDRKGKRLRPIITILTAKMLRNEVPQTTINGAAAIELLHNATLMHDDVIDQSDERRGSATINKVWDNKVAVLMGDFFLAKCLESSNATGSLEVSRTLSDVVIRLSEGELEQLANARSHMMSEDAYFSVISGKTASLFAACTRVAAVSVGADEEEMERLSQIGELMGLIFQIRDDVFDYFPSNNDVGKPTGHDIQEGKVTLPLLFALKHAPSDESARMKSIIEKNGELSEQDIATLVEFAKAMGGIEYALARMKEMAFEAKKQLATFPEKPSRKTLMSLIDYLISRNK